MHFGRDVYYACTTLFESQHRSDRVLQRICKVLGCCLRDLHVVGSLSRMLHGEGTHSPYDQVAAPRGLVHGLLELHLPRASPNALALETRPFAAAEVGMQKVSCREPTAIPVEISAVCAGSLRVTMLSADGSPPQFLLVVE